MFQNKNKNIKNIHLFDHCLTNIKNIYLDSTSYTINNIKTTTKNQTQLISRKNSSKSPPKFNLSKKFTNNLHNINGNYKNKNIKRSLKSLMYFNILESKIKKIELDKKYENSIREKNDIIYTLQKEIEYYKNIVKNNKNDKYSLPKNFSKIFLSKTYIDKEDEIKTRGIAEASNLYLKNILSYYKGNSSKLINLNKNNSQKFISKENSNINNSKLIIKIKKNSINYKETFSNNIKIDPNNLKQKHNILTDANFKRINYLKSIKSYNKKNNFNFDEMPINDYISNNNNILNINSFGPNDIRTINELKNKKNFEIAIKKNSLHKSKSRSYNIYSNKNLLKKVNSNSKNSFFGEICGMESYSNYYYKEKFEGIINRMEHLLDKLFSIVDYNKEGEIYKNK